MPFAENPIAMPRLDVALALSPDEVPSLRGLAARLEAEQRESGRIEGVWFSIQTGQEAPWRLVGLFVAIGHGESRRVFDATPPPEVSTTSERVINVDITEWLGSGQDVRLMWVAWFGEKQPLVVPFVVTSARVVEYPRWTNVKQEDLRRSEFHPYPPANPSPRPVRDLLA